jgi:hypothetical protein
VRTLALNDNTLHSPCYLLHVSDLPLALKIRDSDGDSSYADDTAVWVVVEDHEEAYTRANGLALNGAKTQVMVGGKGKPPPPPPSPSTLTARRSSPWAPLISWLGVTFDRQFTVKPYLHSLARES